MLDCIDELTSEKKQLLDKLLSINIAVPGLVNSDIGMIHFSSDMNLKQLPIVKILQDQYGKHVHIENDANAAAANSLLQSEFNDEKSIYFLFFLPKKLLSLKEIGAGIIIDNKIYKGASSAAGEVRIKNYWMLDNLDQIEATQLEKLDQKLLEENESIRHYICNFSERIASVIHFLDPKKIILGGDINKFSDFLRNYTLTKILEYSSKKRDNGFIQIDQGGIESVAKGSTVSFLISFFNDFEKAKEVLSSN
jgi:predicted NBD/HSP70 family sugar kinase